MAGYVRGRLRPSTVGMARAVALFLRRSMCTLAQEEDVKTTVQLLRLLTRNGADVDLERNNGEVALHTAARRGPVQAIWVLLLSKATHDVVDHRTFTPEGAAERAGNKDFVALLANWPISRLKYLDSEFVQEWMKFLCDSDANLDTDLTAEEVLTQVRLEGHEESTAVRARGGHLLVDEVITGPVFSAEEKAQAKMLAFSADAVSLTTTLESSAESVNGISWGEQGRDKNNNGNEAEGSYDEREKGRKTKKIKSKLGQEIDVFLAQARDENAGALAGGGEGGLTAFSRFVAKAQLEGRKSRWPGPRNNGKDPAAGGEASSADPFGRPMTTSQRRRIAALEIAEDGGESSACLQHRMCNSVLGVGTKAFDFLFFSNVQHTLFCGIFFETETISQLNGLF